LNIPEDTHELVVEGSSNAKRLLPDLPLGVKLTMAGAFGPDANNSEPAKPLSSSKSYVSSNSAISESA
jgi:hypothetical protein